jgi:hypothetical protein
VKTELIDALESIATEIADHNGNTISINFDVESYNLIASVWEELERSAKALERIATALENK